MPATFLDKYKTQIEKTANHRINIAPIVGKLEPVDSTGDVSIRKPISLLTPSSSLQNTSALRAKKQFLSAPHYVSKIETNNAIGNAHFYRVDVIFMIKFTAPEDRVIRVTERVTVKVTDKEQKLLTLLAEDPCYSMPQLAERLSVSRKTVAARLKKLKDTGLIEHISSDRKGYWKLLR